MAMMLSQRRKDREGEADRVGGWDLRRSKAHSHGAELTSFAVFATLRELRLLFSGQRAADGPVIPRGTRRGGLGTTRNHETHQEHETLREILAGCPRRVALSIFSCISWS